MAIRISGMNSGLDTESIVSALVSGYQTKVDKQKKAQTKLSWKTEAWQGVNKKVYSLYSNINKLRFTSAYALKKTTVSDNTKATVTASGNAVNGTQTLKIKDLAKAGYLTGGTMSLAEGATAEKLDGSATLKDLGYDLEEGGKITVNGQEISVSGSTTIDNFVNQLNEKGVSASFDANNGRIFVSAKDSGEKNDFSIGASDGQGLVALSKLGLLTDESIKTSYANISGVSEKNIDTESQEYQDFVDAMQESKNGDASRVKGQNATIELNGATFTSATNNFTVNGLTINATATTGNNEITITTATDVDGIYDKVKDFLSEYNEVVNYMQSQYNAASAKGYEPLTDDEKSAMTDTQVEKWEQKIKTSLLRRDQNLNTILNSMSNAMAKSYDINGKKFSLGTFGISTPGYFSAAE
ncbi:MAG: flagellar filament capping protein FliD, partial [Lachnospiraceae bacterium]|nr:flagellar filament capping protein FliD [Lachnospiraceae bacterium]